MTGGDTPIRVSIIVPVFNPGHHIEALIDSLATQTLPQDEFEVVFADDGSTDDSPGRLDRLAERHHNVTVLHGPNSGWPGRPRNLGTDVARGEYVFYVDQDDWLGTEALARMCAFGEKNRSDIVIGRYAGHRRGVAKALFRATQPNATLANTALMDSLTPHKMFRTAFLRDNALRFPEGRRRLEDHVFVAQAYFLANRISVLSDYHCYFHVRRDDAGNAGYQRIDPAGYYGNVREVVDIVLANTKPGAVRDRCLRRTLRVEVLARLDGRKFLEQGTDYQQALFAAARRLTVDAIPPAVDHGLSAFHRVRVALLRDDRLEDLKACVDYELTARATARLLDLDWDDTGGLRIVVDAIVVDETDRPWRYDVHGDVMSLHAPPGMRGPYPRDAAECTKLIGLSKVEVVIRRRGDSEEWPVLTETSLTMHRNTERAWVSLRGHARLAPLTHCGGAPLSDGTWEVFARISQTGWTKDVRLGSRRTRTATRHRRAAVLDHLAIVPYWAAPAGHLRIAVGADGATTLRHTRPPTARVRRSREAADTLHVGVALAVLAGRVPTATVQLRGGALNHDLTTRVTRSAAGELSLACPLPTLERGTWSVLLALGDDDETAAAPIGRALCVSASGRARVRMIRTGDAAAAETQSRRIRVRRTLGALRRRLRRARRRWGGSR